MTKVEYAQYLGNILEEEIKTEDEFLGDQFHSLFQCFMPSGKNVEKVFIPIPNGEQFLQRLLPVYEVTQEETGKKIAEGVSPAYFCPVASGSEEEIIAEGNLYIQNLIEFAEFFKENALLKSLTSIKKVKLNSDKTVEKNDDLNLHLYDSLGHWNAENTDEKQLIEILNEAYYSINCDYFLSYYLQYPKYRNKPKTDFLKPYFNLWKLGYSCCFVNYELIISK